MTSSPAGTVSPRTAAPRPIPAPARRAHPAQGGPLQGGHIACRNGRTTEKDAASYLRSLGLTPIAHPPLEYWRISGRAQEVDLGVHIKGLPVPGIQTSKGRVNVAFEVKTQSAKGSVEDKLFSAIVDLGKLADESGLVTGLLHQFDPDALSPGLQMVLAEEAADHGVLFLAIGAWDRATLNRQAYRMLVRTLTSSQGAEDLYEELGPEVVAALERVRRRQITDMCQFYGGSPPALEDQRPDA
ncbi:hypothetical protein [Bailinhaonella thermotolerans]|uniref:Uncharacterized protein n=1 Tax=Bailinhaonella thermotolerans TaxID=1070861 RepID=A0A3A4AE33_9ACTN|nr:hypothetical protein [Bailinhaonella thermotolerans]RJL23893.1 hypothetical protein D5H75_31125 [Bailinhaonella thermotolerans]